MDYLQKIYSNAFDAGVNFYTQKIFNEDEKTSYGKSSLIGAGIGGTAAIGGGIYALSRNNNNNNNNNNNR